MVDTALADPVLADPAAPHLKKGALGLVDDTVIAVSSTAPAYSVATALSVLGAAVALQMPAAMWVGAIPVFGVAVAFYFLNRQDPNCGASYSWVGKILSPSLGFLNGWVILVADVIFCAFAGPQAGTATLQLLNNANIYSPLGINLNAGDTTAATVVGLLWLVFVTFMVAVGIQVAAKLQWVLCGVEYAIILVLGFWGLKQTGGASFGWDWFDPRGFGSLATLANGVVVAVFLYWGWDTAANLNEETEGSNENPGKAGMLGMIGLLGIFLLSTVSVQMTIPPDQIAASGTGTLNLWATTIFPQPWASLGVLALVSSTVATLQTTLLPGVRTAFSMGRDRTLGRVWTEVHPRFKTPFFGTLLMFAIIAAVAIVDLKLDKLNAIVTAGVTAIGILVAFYYGMAAIASTVYFRKQITTNPGLFLVAGLFPLLSGLSLLALGGYLIYYDWTNSGDLVFDATNLKFQALIPIVVILSGVPVLLWSRLRYNSDFYRTKRSVAPAGAALPAPAGGGGGGH